MTTNAFAPQPSQPQTPAPTTRPALGPGAEPAGRSGRVGRVVVTCLLGSALLAVGLVVAIAGSATEPVVAGMVLLAFAAGWATLAWISGRRTDQPQPWAWLPALVFGGIGLAYVALRPGAGAMNASGWVWPIVLTVVAAWVARRSRRTLAGWSRRLVVLPIVAVMLLVGVGSAYQTVREATDSAAHTMTGQLVSVGDHKLRISCRGTGSPTVVLQPGLGEPAVMMAGWIQPAVAATTRVCVYDRAGRGDSEAASGVQDGFANAADLHRLLANAHVPGPYVLLGHSSGAAYVKVFAHQYPQEVAGMVLLDGQPSDAYANLPGWSTFYFGLRRYSGIAPSLARIGVMRLIYTSAVGGLPAAARSEERQDWSSSKHNRSFRDEVAALRTALAQSQALTSLDGKPLFVVTAAKNAQRGWLPLQEEVLRLSTNSRQLVVADATHESLVEDQHQAGVSVAAIDAVVTAVRTGAPLGQS